MVDFVDGLINSILAAIQIDSSITTPQRRITMVAKPVTTANELAILSTNAIQRNRMSRDLEIPRAMQITSLSDPTFELMSLAMLQILQQHPLESKTSVNGLSTPPLTHTLLHSNSLFGTIVPFLRLQPLLGSVANQSWHSAKGPSP
jgi:hypothetical protein